MAAGSNPLAGPLVFAAQAGSAVSGGAHTGLISGSHRPPLITLLLLLLRGARTNRETDKQTDRFHFPLKEKSLSTRYQACRYACVLLSAFSHFVACSVLTSFSQDVTFI